MKVQKGDNVKVEYTGSFDDGTVFDSSEKHGKPLEFEVGAGKMIKGFDAAVVGMEEGEEKNIRLDPGDAYGGRDENLVKEIPASSLPEGAKEGGVVAVAFPNGAQMGARITGIEGDTAKIDLNHPMAGKTLNFKVKVVGIGK